MAAITAWLWGADRPSTKPDVETPAVGGASTRTDGGNLILPSTAGHPTPFSPWIHGEMPVDMRARLTTGFELAVSRVMERPECRGLFEALGADALDTLRSNLYFPVTSHYKAKKVCRRRAAYSHVGGRAVFLCRCFPSRSDRRAAICILHEALHSAGLEEFPQNPGAMTSREINTMIISACGL